ncbi:MAG: ATP synthase F0 subunit C [bacterium]
MNISFDIGFALPIAVGLAALGSGLGLGRAVEGAMNAMGRQPEASGKIQLAMLLGCAFIEALTIYALVVFIMGQATAKELVEVAKIWAQNSGTGTH